MIRRSVQLRKQNSETNLALSLPKEIVLSYDLQAGQSLQILANEKATGIIILITPENETAKQADKIALKEYLSAFIKAEGEAV